ncbi:MAG TPA: IS256 family transposase [Pirellulaceae bacterium]|nr:IS256 family transposase [Pirellulaceae bacterium]
MDASLQKRAEQLATEFASQARTAEDLNGLIRLMMKSGLERMLNTELDVHLGRRPSAAGLAASPADESPAVPEPLPAALAKLPKRGPNRRNGKTPKTVQGDLGELTIDTPRDRDGTFEPVLIPKHQRRVPGFDEKILALYAKGMTTRDIQEIVKELYGVEVSPTLISEITSDLDAEVTAWRTRSLDPVWPIVYFDGIVVHVRGANGRVSQHTVYVALGVNLEGKKELLGLWLAETEGAKFWLTCLTDLQNRGLQDIFVACIDGLAGFAEAIHTAYPKTSVQLCLVHLVRAALRYVSTQDSQAVARDLKKVYQAATVIEAEQMLTAFAQAWDAKYPTIAKMWRAKWTDIITLFDYPPAIRKAIYTTNAIESVNSVIRKFTRNRKIYPSEESALKNVYMAIREASARWTMPIHHWKQALNHFAILFEDRMPKTISN